MNPAYERAVEHHRAYGPCAIDGCAICRDANVNEHKWTGPYPAERENGIMHSYYECDLCGVCCGNPDEHDVHNPECPA